MVTVKGRDIASDELLSGEMNPEVGCPDFSSRSGSMSVIPSRLRGEAAARHARK